MPGIIREGSGLVAPYSGTIEVQEGENWVEDDQIEILNYKAFEGGTGGFIKYHAAAAAPWKGNRPSPRTLRIKTDSFTEVLTYTFAYPFPLDSTVANIVTLSCTSSEPEAGDTV